MSTSRVWRDFAIEWFDAMNREIGRHFTRSFLDKLHRALNVGTEEELLDLRFEYDMRRRRVDEIVRTPEKDRLIGGAWEFHLLCETFFVALCDLALEDFRCTHIVNVAQIMTNERGMQTFTYEETP